MGKRIKKVERRDYLKQEFIDKLPVQNITNVTSVHGGDVNLAYKVETSTDPLFLLVQPNTDDSFYYSEIEGLKDFERIGITAPRVVDSGTINDDAFLLISYLEEGQSGSQRALGELVAKLHNSTNVDKKFGYHAPHRGSSITFSNDWTMDWKTQYINGRLDPLMKRLLDEGKWSEKDKEKYEVARKIMIDTLNTHDSKPSLLHGDLWAGNYMFLKDGRPALFDPSPFYGDREFDLGATVVFGGFNQDFYEAYNEHYKLDDNAWYRINFYKLYLLMVHLLKFGNVYYNSVNQTLSDIINQ